MADTGESSVQNNSESTSAEPSRLQMILDTIEFYFSDINLSRNRFLAHKILEDPYVPISLLITFHKLKELTEDESVVAEAVKLSKMLHLTEDGSKVFRTTEIQSVDQIDEHIIYVENVPMNKDQEWLQKIFSAYGTVLYVSLPVYKRSRENKGFAFVEFASEKEALIAFEAFQSSGLTIDLSIAPEELLSIKTHEEPTSEVPKAVNRKDLVNSIVETRDLSQLGLKIMFKGEWKRIRNKFLNKLHIQNKQIQTSDKNEEECNYKKGLVVKLEKEKHNGNLDDYLAGIRLRPNGGVVYITNKPKENFVFIRFHTVENATDFLNPECPHITLVEGDEEAQYWEKVANIIAAKKQWKTEQRVQRKREKRRAQYTARNLDTMAFEEEDGGATSEQISFDSLLEQRNALQQQGLKIDPDLKSKRKKKRDKKSHAKTVNKHIYFGDSDEAEELKDEPAQVSNDLKREAETAGDQPPTKRALIAESSEI